MVDEILGAPPALTSAEETARLLPLADREGRPYQARPWPALSAAEGGGPVIGRMGDEARDVEHPIHDARAALTIPFLAPSMAKILRANDLKLIHQNYRRTVPSPPPYPQYCGDGVLGRQIQGSELYLHMDSGFLPEHSEGTPRQNYYLALTALSPVVSGGAAFCFAPGSFAAAKRAGAALPSSAKASINAATCPTELKSLLEGHAGSEVQSSRAVAQEVELETGDTLVFDLMLSREYKGRLDRL